MIERVVVTGASAGIGAACVDLFRERGAHVIGVDVAGTSMAHDHLQIDLADPHCGDLLAAHLRGEAVDGLVNNAAVSLDKAADEVNASEFDELFAVNLRAPLLLAGALRKMLEARRGFVVNVASVHAVATSRLVSVYAASKGGLVALTRALAVEWAPDVRVNAVLPGAIDTDMLRSGLERIGMTASSMGAKHPIGRVGDASEVAAAVLFFAENQFATGSTLIVDGGATAHLSTE